MLDSLAWRAEEPDEEILKNHEGWSQNGQVFGTEEFRIEIKLLTAKIPQRGLHWRSTSFLESRGL